MGGHSHAYGPGIDISWGNRHQIQITKTKSGNQKFSDFCFTQQLALLLPIFHVLVPEKIHLQLTKCIPEWV